MDPVIPPGTLWERLRERTETALAAGALKSIPTAGEEIEEVGMRFSVRVLTSLLRKEEERWQQERESPAGRKANPFLPYEEELFVGGLTKTHLCLLNKFNVVDHHLLVVTRSFEDQDRYLTVEDCEALLLCLAEYDGLAFYNGGRIAGASQRHKHLQFVPLPLAAEGGKVPLDDAFAGVSSFDGPGGSAILPFRHSLAPMEREWVDSPGESAGRFLRRYHRMLQAAGMERGDTPDGDMQSGPYNFLVTREWMLLVPRAGEFFGGISINSLGFAGSFFVRNETELQALKSHGPMAVLEGVSFPAGG